jgi:hypothetical protein
MGYKRREEDLVMSGQRSLLPEQVPPPRAKLRVTDVASSPTAQTRGIRIPRNMRVPQSSVVTRAFRDPLRGIHNGRDPLEDWQTSSGGAVGHGTLGVEAWRIEDEGWALLRILDD